jgi:hypothetical protein
MEDLVAAISLIEQQVTTKQARCVIVDEGFPDESSLYGTRDGYLNLTLALLRFLAESDAGNSEVEDDGQVWGNQVTRVLYKLPTRSAAWLVGTHLFKSHDDFVAALSAIVDPQIGAPLLNDPQFRNPVSAPEIE